MVEDRLIEAETFLAPSPARLAAAGPGWAGTCAKPDCAHAVLEPVRTGPAERPRLRWTCPNCGAAHGALDVDERARFAALCA